MVINMRIALMLTFPCTALILLLASSGPVGRIEWWCGASWQTVGLGRSCFILFASVRSRPFYEWHGGLLCCRCGFHFWLHAGSSALFFTGALGLSHGVPGQVHHHIIWTSWGCGPSKGRGTTCRVSRRPFVRHSERFFSRPVPRPGRLHMRTAACGSSLSPIHRGRLLLGQPDVIPGRDLWGLQEARRSAVTPACMFRMDQPELHIFSNLDDPARGRLLDGLRCFCRPLLCSRPDRRSQGCSTANTTAWRSFLASASGHSL